MVGSSMSVSFPKRSRRDRKESRWWNPFACRGLDGTFRNRQAPPLQGGKGRRPKQKGESSIDAVSGEWNDGSGRLVPLPQRPYFEQGRPAGNSQSTSPHAQAPAGRTQTKLPDEQIRAQSKVALNSILSLNHPIQSNLLCFDVFVRT